jgi:hypothetical protein
VKTSSDGSVTHVAEPNSHADLSMTTSMRPTEASIANIIDAVTAADSVQDDLLVPRAGSIADMSKSVDSRRSESCV